MGRQKSEPASVLNAVQEQLLKACEKNMPADEIKLLAEAYATIKRIDTPQRPAGMYAQSGMQRIA